MIVGAQGERVDGAAAMSRLVGDTRSGALVRLHHPDWGDILTQGVVPVLSRTPGRVAGWSRAPGGDNDAVLGGLLGYTPRQIREGITP